MFRRQPARWAAAAVLLWTSVLAARAVGAPDEVDGLIGRANALRQNGNDQGALPLLQRAYQLRPEPRTAVHLGLVESALGRWADADRHLTEGLGGAEDAWIKKNRATIVEAARNAKQKVGSLEIKGEPPGAEVLVNGTTVGTFPLAAPVVVNAGTADVEVRANGFRSQARSVTVLPQVLQPVVIRLDPQGSGAPIAGTVPGGGRAPGLAGPIGNDLLQHEQPPPADGGGRRPWWWLRMGATAAVAASAAVGAYGFLQYRHKLEAFRGKTDASNRPRCFESGNAVVDAGGRPAASDCITLRSQYRTARTVAMAGLIGAGVTSALAIALWVVRPGEQEHARGRGPAYQYGFAFLDGGAVSASYRLTF
jgi:hypothetical protein